MNYVLNVKYGSVEFAPCAPGFTRLVTRDEHGNVTKDVTSHYVCLGSDKCMFCGEPMNNPDKPDRKGFCDMRWHSLKFSVSFRPFGTWQFPRYERYVIGASVIIGPIVFNWED